MGLDAIIIANNEDTSLSGSSPFKLSLDGITADVQVVLNFIKNQGQIIHPIDYDGRMSWSSTPRLNGIYLLNYLLSNHFKVELINNYFHERDQFVKLIRESPPRVVVISTTFIHKKQDLLALVADIRSIAPDIFIIAGGPFVHLSFSILKRSKERHYDIPEIADDFLFFNFNEPQIDLYIISVRGEDLLCAALRKFINNSQFDDLPNLAFFKNNEYRFTHRLDDIAIENKYNINWESLPDYVFKTGVISMQASTGCPFKCAYCNFTKDPRLLYVRPIDELIQEMKTVQKRNIKYIWFVDDNFRFGKRDLVRFCRRILSENFDLHWMTFIRADSLIDMDLELLYKAGCRELQLGLESADLQILKNMNKKVHPSVYSKVIKDLLSIGIDCSCYFICGFPGETDMTIKRTIDFIKDMEHPERTGALSWSIFPFMLAPLSPIFETQMREKYELTGYMHHWRHKTMDSDQAKNYIKKFFFEIEKSGPIYRGDNQEIMQRLDPYKRKQFIVKRHELSRSVLKVPFKNGAIMNAFLSILGPA